MYDLTVTAVGIPTLPWGIHVYQKNVHVCSPALWLSLLILIVAAAVQTAIGQELYITTATASYRDTGDSAAQLEAQLLDSAGK